MNSNTEEPVVSTQKNSKKIPNNIINAVTIILIMAILLVASSIFSLKYNSEKIAEKSPSKTDIKSFIQSKLGDEVLWYKEIKPANLYMVKLGQGQTIYASTDLKYFTISLNGVLSVVAFDDKFTNLGDEALRPERKALMDTMESDSTITVKSNNEKHVVTVFVDAACSFCQMMNEQIEDYKKLGITIKYAAMPIFAPVTHEALNRIYSMPKDEQHNALVQTESLFKSLRGKDIDFNDLPLPPPTEIGKSIVTKHHEIGKGLGITGTPAIVLKDGTLLSGYVKPEELIKTLNSRFN